MSALPPDEHRKLKAILGLLGSDAEGERSSAARKASELMARHKVGWDDLLPDPTPFAVGFIAPRKPVRPDPSYFREDETDHQRLARVLLQTGFPWNDWQRQFLRDQHNVLRPSANQKAKLRELHDLTGFRGEVR